MFPRPVVWCLPYLLIGCSLVWDTAEEGEATGSPSGTAGEASSGKAGSGGRTAGSGGSGAASASAGTASGTGQGAGAGTAGQAGAAGLAGQNAGTGGSSQAGMGGTEAGESSGGLGGVDNAGGSAVGGESATGGSSSGAAGWTCGNGVREGNENCDGADIAWPDCKSYYATKNLESEGVLVCGPDCGLDVSGCTRCGDGIINNKETCDGTNIPATLTCKSILGGVSTGPVTCSAICSPLVLDCSPACNPISNEGCNPGERCFPSYVTSFAQKLRCLSGWNFGPGAACSKGVPCQQGFYADVSTGNACLPFCKADADCMGTPCNFAVGADGFGVCTSYPCP